MGADLTVACGDGIVNLWVGAIILKDGRFLMTGNRRSDYLYSVGGRIQFGETAEQAVRREVLEETGVALEVERLGFVHENFFFSDQPAHRGMLVYELSFFFYMRVPEDFAPVSGSFTEDGQEEFLCWVSPEDERTLYPAFFRQELGHPAPCIRHFVTDEREKE